MRGLRPGRERLKRTMPKVSEDQYRCIKCKQILLASAFTPSALESHRYCCKKCRGEYNHSCRREYNREYSETYSRRLRREVLEGYGGKCVDCGESDWMVLQIDHIDGSTNTSRGRPSNNSTAFLDLISHGFPPGIELRCANCHMRRTFYSGRA